jgi:DNA helicase-2/ATP-dependent DNA helicase PcrA
VDELPKEHVEVLTPPGLAGTSRGMGHVGETPGMYQASSLETRATQADAYNSPGWRRMQARRGERGMGSPREARNLVIDAEAVAAFSVGERVFHQKFGYGVIEDMEGDKMTVAFDKAGTKRVVAAYLKAADAAASDDVPF